MHVDTTPNRETAPDGPVEPTPPSEVDDAPRSFAARVYGRLLRMPVTGAVLRSVYDPEVNDELAGYDEELERWGL